MTKRFFVTGTDTEVGKTIASSALLQAANLLGFHTAGYKPVASGSELTGDGLRNEDALALQRHSRVALRYDQVNPYTFAEPTSPHIISADEGRPIAAARLSSGLRELEGLADWVLVEGEAARGAVITASGLKERTGRTLLGQLLTEGLLLSDTPKGDVRLGLPIHAAGWFFPDLYPTLSR